MGSEQTYVLEEVGLGKNEAKAYLALLELGSATAGQVADKAGVHRATAYEAIELMVKKGIVSHFMKNNVRYYQATPPENLLRILKEKEEKLKGILPELALKRQFSDAKSEANVFEGVKAFMDLYYGFLKYKQPIYVYGLTSEVPKMLKNHLPNYHRERISQGIPIQHVYNHDATERIELLNSMKLTEARNLPPEFDSTVSTWICGDEVVHTVWTSNPISIQIVNKAMADAYRKYFKVLWNMAK
jgi:predicted transcriptional regulator